MKRENARLATVAVRREAPMSIISVTRWEINQDQAQSILRDVAPLLKNQGAHTVSIGRIHTGPEAGNTIVSVTYENWEAYGRAMNAQQNDQNYQQRFQDAQKAGKLLGRTLVVAELIQ